MLAFLFTVALFAAFSLIGVAVLSLVRAETGSLRTSLIAPILGAAVLVIIMFSLSRAGLVIGVVATPVIGVVLAASVLAIIRRRPELPTGLLPIGGALALALALIGWPMLEFGFRWLANGNDDMANYSLSAARLMTNPFWAGIDVAGLAGGTDYPTGLTLLAQAARPGADVLLATAASVADVKAFEAYMPLTLAFGLCLICATAAIVLQATGRVRAAWLAALLMAISPLATFGVVQQLIAQTFALGLSVGLLALIATKARPGVRDLVPAGLLATALAFTYPEFVPFIGLAYVLYVGLIAIRGELRLRSLGLLLGGLFAFVAVLLNSFVIREIQFLLVQGGVGLTKAGIAPTFGFVFIPSAIPATLGLTPLVPDFGSTIVAAEIVAGILILVAVLVFSFRQALAESVAAITVLVMAGVAGVLLFRGSDFGPFKIMMWVQPFLVATIALALAEISGRTARWVAIGSVPLLVAVVLTQQAYVRVSANPVDLANSSSETLMPAFEAIVEGSERPVVSTADNLVLMKLQAVAAVGHELRFLARSPGFFLVGGEGYGSLRESPAETEARESLLVDDRLFSSAGRRARFQEDTAGSASLAAGDCDLALSTGAQVPFNRRSLPESGPNIVGRTCGGAHDLLVFENSDIGSHYYGFPRRQDVAFYQLEPDVFYPEATFSGVGRYLLFRVLGPPRATRLAISLTKTPRVGEDTLPPASVIGSQARKMDIEGNGSARVIAPPVRPLRVGDGNYLLIDMGVAGSLMRPAMSGPAALWGGTVEVDPRYLTSYVRDISLIPNDEYSALRRPSALTDFPADLTNPDLEYSGIYEDGFVGARSYAYLNQARNSDLVVEGEVFNPVPPDSPPGQIEVLVDGRSVAREAVKPGRFALTLPIKGSGTRRVELRFDAAGALSEAEQRQVSARLQRLGFLGP